MEPKVLTADELRELPRLTINVIEEQKKEIEYLREDYSNIIDKIYK